MSVRFSQALAVQRRLFDYPLEERRERFLHDVLEPMGPALTPPGVPPSGDLLEVARTYGFMDPDGEAATYEPGFALLDRERTVERCEEILQRAFAALDPLGHGIDADIVGHVVVADPGKSHMLAVDDGYTGYGGHSGHGVVHVNVSELNIRKIPAALAHEYHHNIRLRYEPWTRETSVGQYMLVEGLAEAFAVELCGEAFAGPWVTRQTPGERERARRIIGSALDVSGWNEIRSYIFGDWMAEQCGQPARGLVRSAGYAVGYDCVRAYCAKTGSSVAEATYVPWREIVAESGFLEGVHAGGL